MGGSRAHVHCDNLKFLNRIPFLRIMMHSHRVSHAVSDFERVSVTTSIISRKFPGNLRRLCWKWFLEICDDCAGNLHLGQKTKKKCAGKP